MEIGSLAGESSKALGPRATLVNLLPAALLTLVVVALVGAGAPGDPQLGNAIKAFEDLNGARLAVLGLTVLGVAVVLQPFQIAVVQLLEGYWTTSPLKRGGSALAKMAFEFGVEIQRRRQVALSVAQRTDHARFSQVQQAWLGQEVSSYPARGDLLPTRLGNVLRAAELRAGGRYGLDFAPTFPRLYPQMSDRFATAWEDQTDQLDTAAHLCVTFLLATLLSGALLVPHGWDGYWLLIPLATGTLAWISYRATIAAAKHWGDLLMAAFDLHRFDMLAQLRRPLPQDAHNEFEANQRLSAFLGDATAEERLKQYTKNQPMEPVEGYEHAPPAAESSPTAPDEIEPLIWKWDTVDAAMGGDGESRLTDDGPRSAP